MAKGKGYLEVLAEVLNVNRAQGKKIMVINKYLGPIPEVVEVEGVELLQTR
jgi:hypothetical protein